MNPEKILRAALRDYDRAHPLRRCQLFADRGAPAWVKQARKLFTGHAERLPETFTRAARG